MAESTVAADPAVVARPVEFPKLEPRAASGPGSTLESLRDVPITVTARLGHTVLPIGEILTLGPGSVVELNEVISAPVELTVRGVPFAVGEVVVVGDHFAVRIKRGRRRPMFHVERCWALRTSGRKHFSKAAKGCQRPPRGGLWPKPTIPSTSHKGRQDCQSCHPVHD